MSDSLLPEGRAHQSPTDSSVERQIDAEIADHLAAAAERLKREGLGDEEAQRQAVARFGNLETVRNRLWWIYREEEIMLRTAAIVLAVLLIVGLLAIGYGGWHLQRSLDDRMKQLASQLDALNQTQQKLLDQQVTPATPSITGRVYLADPTQPAVGATVQICRVSSEVQVLNTGPQRKQPDVVRNLRADSEGRFHSGPLGDGDYYVFAPLLPLDSTIGTLKGYYTQTEPIYLYGGRTPPPIELDVRLKSGKLRIELSQPLASQVDLPEPERDSPKPENNFLAVGMQLTAQRLGNHVLPWSPVEAQPPAWPISGSRGGSTTRQLALPRNLPLSFDLPVGEYRISALVAAGQPRNTPYSELTDRNLADTILAHSGSRTSRGGEDSVAGVALQVQEGQETVVVVQVPPGYEDELRNASDELAQGFTRETLRASFWPLKMASE